MLRIFRQNPIRSMVPPQAGAVCVVNHSRNRFILQFSSVAGNAGRNKQKAILLMKNGPLPVFLLKNLENALRLCLAVGECVICTVGRYHHARRKIAGLAMTGAAAGFVAVAA